MNDVGPAIEIRGVITLANVLTRDLSLQTHEAIAVVLAVVDRLAEPSGAPLRIPDLHQIVLAGDGSIECTGGVMADRPVARLGQLFQALLSECEPPVQLRLLAAQATAPVPLYASIAEYGDAIGQFERVDRHAVLQALYCRATAAPVCWDGKARRTVQEHSAAPAPNPPAAPTEPPRPRRRIPRRVLLAMAAVVPLAAAGTVSLAYVRTHSLGFHMPHAAVDQAIGRATDAVDRVSIAGMSAVTETLGLGRLVPPGAKGGTPLAAAPPKLPVVTLRHPARRPLKATQRPFIAFDLERAPAMVRPVHPSTDGVESAHVERAKPLVPADSDVVYSVDSAGVIPPVGVHVKLTRELPPEIDTEKLARMELVVASDGRVDSVRLLDRPRNVHEVMFLSVAKAWEFRPALKDGIPVRYRKTIWVLPQ